MKVFMTKLLNSVKKRLWLIVIVLLTIILLPSRKTISEDLRVYNYSNEKKEDRTIHFDISIIKHNKIPLISRKRDVLLEVEGRKYRYVASNFPERKETYIPLEINPFKFGVVLPNKDFTEFVILFDENHHFDVSNDINFIVYPQKSHLESLNLLKELMEYNNYNVEQRPMY